MDRLDAMQAFVRLVEVGTFSAVAEELRVKQSTVSKWIAATEAQLGVQLLERTTRSLRVTDQGQVFYARAKEILASYDDVVSRVTEAAPELRGRLRVSVPVVFGRLFVVPAVTEWMRRHAGVELELVFSDRYVNLVEEGFDLAVRVGVPVDTTFRSRKIGETSRYLVAAPEYLASAPVLSGPEHLRHHDCLVHTGLHAGAVWQFRRAGRRTRARVTGRFAANNAEALLSLARGGQGIALLASWVVLEDLDHGRLVRLLPEYEPPAAAIQALSPPGQHQPPHARAFVDFFAEHLERALAGQLHTSPA
jgi:DNA-binding transcriptional LysR family regulator